MMEECLGCGCPIERGEYCVECLKERMALDGKQRDYIN